MTDRRTDTEVAIVVVVAPALGRVHVDPLTGAVAIDERGAVLSAADAAALEVALSLGEAWQRPVTAVSVGGALACSVLEAALAVGVARALWVEHGDDASALGVADAVADVLTVALGDTAAPFVVAGVHGSDFGSAAVPAFLADRLGAEQALGLVDVRAGGVGRAEVVRRLDHGARERLAVSAPAVLSVEGSVASLRRAGLRAMLATDAGRIERVASTTIIADSGDVVARPWRPPVRVVAGPEGDTALERIRDLTGVAGPNRQSRTIELDPAAAAEEILDQLGAWGYGPRAVPE